MKVFSYIANGMFGRTSCGVIVADSKEKALILLQEEFNAEDISVVIEIPLKEGVSEIDFYY